MQGVGPTANDGLNSQRAAYLPGVAFLRGYNRQWLGRDLLAGLTVCVVMIPTVIAYAGLMGLPAQYGLYAALVPLAVYPFFGGSRQIMVGPDIAICLLIVSAVRPLAQNDPARLAALAGTVTVLSGLIMICGALARVGSVANFFSKPVLVGYMTGAALILVASQLNTLFGVKLVKHQFFPRLAELCGKLEQTNPITLIVGLCLIFLIILLRRFAPKVPSSLTVCIVAVIACRALGLEQHGVAVVGSLPAGLPSWAMPPMDLETLATLLPAAIAIALLSYTEGILLARSFGAKNGYDVDANQELVALGVSDVVTGFFRGFAGTGSQARTAINDDAGGKTPLVSLIAAAALALFLLFLTPLIARLPEVALAAILVCGGFSLVEFDAMVRIYRHYPQSASLAAITTLAVLAAGVVPGILIGVGLSLLGLIKRISDPADAVLRLIPGHGFHDFGDDPGGETVPGLVVYRFYAPLLFSNASHFAARVRQVILDSKDPVQWFLLDAQAITDIDVTAAEMLHSLHSELMQQHIELKIAHANHPWRSTLERTGLASELRENSFYPSVHECLAAFRGKY